MKRIVEGIKYWGQLLLLPIYWFSFLFPRSKNIWLFGSTFGNRFADNPRYFYLYISQMGNEKKIRPIWISHSKEIVQFLNEKGYEAYYYHSLKGIWYCLRGKVYCFDNYSKDISFWLSGGAIKFNMWHGVGNKCINYDNKHDQVRHPKNAWERFKYFPRRLSDEKPSHYILTTSPMMSEIFARAFQVPKNHIIEAGYPRNDMLFQGVDNKGNIIENIYLPEEQRLIDNLKQWKNQGVRMVGYLPTFRESECKFFDVCNLEELNKFFGDKDIMMVCKLHPKSRCKKEFEKMEYSNIYVVPPTVDVYVFLGQMDALIADYSSVYSDYMLLDRPVVAFHYDYKEYATDTRDAYFDFDEYMPEKKAYDMDELMNRLEEVLANDECLEKRRQFRGKMYKDADGNSSERLLSMLLPIIKKSMSNLQDSNERKRGR